MIRIITMNVLTLLAVGLLTGCEGDRDVERGLARAMNDRVAGRMVQAAVEKVRCETPQKGKALSCVIDYDDDFELPSVTVQLPADTSTFPSKFKFEHWTEDDGFSGPMARSSLSTPLDGTTVPAKVASDALEATVMEAIRRALEATPNYEHQRKKVLNYRSYQSS